MVKAKKTKQAAAAAAAASAPTLQDPRTPPLPAAKRQRKVRASAAATAEEDSVPHATAAPQGAESQALAATEEEGVAPVASQQKAPRRRRQPDPLPCTDPTPELLTTLSNCMPSPRPVPNLGYACLCMDLRELNPPVFTSRDCIKRTMQDKGLPHLGELCLANCRDLARVIQWNHEHGIRFFRMSSVLWPWMGTYDPTCLPQYQDIAAALRFAGDLATAYDQRVTFHPSHFIKLAATSEALVSKSIAELEAHSQILDLMFPGSPPSPVNKINIHVGGVYSEHGDKQATMRRWADNFRRLSPACQARMTVENDDAASAFSLQDLLYLHELCGVPLVFDFHHHRFCPGEFTEEQALRAAVSTWPADVRPVVHWSESSGPSRKAHAHSDYVRGPIDARTLHGLHADLDVMIESKRKERSLLALRAGNVPLDEWQGSGGG